MNQNLSDLDSIHQCVQFYFDGMYESDVEKLKKAFHSTAFLIGYYEGNLAHIPLNNWLEMIEKTPPPRDNGEAYDMKIVSVDITDNVAVVKVADLYLGLRFTDYLSLMKIEGSWRIVNKAFHHEPRS